MKMQCKLRVEPKETICNFSASTERMLFSKPSKFESFRKKVDEDAPARRRLIAKA